MNQPETVILKGRVIDLTCAVKGKAMTGTWNNVAEDHMLAVEDVEAFLIEKGADSRNQARLVGTLNKKDKVFHLDLY